MHRLAPYLASLLALQMVACAGASGDSNASAASGGAGTSPPEGGSGASTAAGAAGTTPTGGGTAASSGGAHVATGGATGSGGAGVGGKVGTGGSPTTGGTSGMGGATTQTKPCALFHDGWSYQVGTYYEPGEEPIVTGVYGTAEFHADGTYEQNYRIGGISNIYSGIYEIAGDQLTTYDESGETAFVYSFSCSDELRELVLIIENDDGTPSIVYGLESLKE